MSHASDRDEDGTASSAGQGVAYPAMTLAEKKLYAAHPDRAIPLRALAKEFRLVDAACNEPDTNTKNCRHNVHCLHGLGVHRKGIWDGWMTGVRARPAWMQLLGPNPHDRARAAGSRVGLQNLGATCYLNTLFQFLFMDPIFRRAVYQYEPPLTLPSESVAARTKAHSQAADAEDLPAAAAQPPSEPHLHHLQQVFTHLEHSNMSHYNPSHLVNALKLPAHDQQDVHEFLNLLVFQLLESELQQSSNPICRQLIPKLFTGQTVHVMEGESCHHQSERLSEFHDLSSIQIKGKKTLEECLDHYFQEEEMRSDRVEDRWKCGTCNQRENAVRRTYLKDPPPILILQLGRFEFDPVALVKKKLGDAIKLPHRLDLAKYIQPPKGERAAEKTNGDKDAPATSANAASVSSMDVSDSAAAAAPPSTTPKRGRGKKAAATAASTTEAAAKGAKSSSVTPSKRKRAAERTDEAHAEHDAVAAAAASHSIPTSSLSGLRVHEPSTPSPVGPAATRRRAAAKKGHGKVASAAPEEAVDVSHDSVSIDLTNDTAPDADAACEAARRTTTRSPIHAPPQAEVARSAGNNDAVVAMDTEEPTAAGDVAPLEPLLHEPVAPPPSRAPALRLRKIAQPKAATPTHSPSLSAVAAPDAPKSKQQKTKKDQTAGSAAATAATVEPTQPAKKKRGRATEPTADVGQMKEDAQGEDAHDDEIAPPAVVLDASGAYMYELVAILLHKGPSANRGHYTAEIKDQTTGQWFTFDDAKVTRKAPKKSANAGATGGVEGDAVPQDESKGDSTTDGDAAATAIDVELAGDAANAASSDVEITGESVAPVEPARKGRARAPKAVPAAPADEKPKRGRKPRNQQSASSDTEQPSDAAAPKRRKPFAQLDDEENGDEESYDPKPKRKKAGRPPKAAAKAAKPKGEGKADVSVGAASTAYILIYRRCNTMQPGWNPFTEEEQQIRDAATTKEEMKMEIVNDDAAAGSSAESAPSSAFLSSSSPALLLEPVLAQNAALAQEQSQYDARCAHLTSSAESRRAEVDQLLRVIEPSDFTEVASALAAVAPTTPISEASTESTGVRHSARRASLRQKESTDASTPTSPVDLASVQMGHYVSTQWLSAYLTGWVVEKAAASAEEDAEESTVKEDAKESVDDAPIDVDADLTKDETDSPAASSEEKGSGEEKSLALQSAPAASLTPLQSFLHSHPDNDELPWPGDLMESLDTIKCSHGKLDPTKMHSAKRISCAAWKILYQANEAWRATHQQADQTQLDQVKVEPRSQSPAAGQTPAAHTATPATNIAVALSPSSSSPVCVLPSCTLPGLTDADLCQSCARVSLLGATVLQDEHERHMVVYNEYLEWDARQKELESADDGKTTFDDGFLVSSAWWRTWKKELDAVAKALGITPITQKKKPKAATPAAIAARSQKPLPKIDTAVSATEDIRCEHGRLTPDTQSIPVSKSVWRHLLALFTSSLPVPIDSLDEKGQSRACADCQSALDLDLEAARDRKDRLKTEKGKLRFIKNLTQFEDFPASTKAPTDGVHHLMPTEWARKLYYYLTSNSSLKTSERPEPMSTATLLCKHGLLQYAPFPEEDQPTDEVLAAVVAASAAAAAPDTPEATATVATAPPPPSKIHSTPTGVVTICDDAEYAHLQSQNWISTDSSSVDITLTVSKNTRNVTGDLSSWTRVHVECSPGLCTPCIAARLEAEQTDALDFTDETLEIHRIKAEEKVDEFALMQQVIDGRRASTRKKTTTRLKDRKPVKVEASSSDTIYTLKLRIFAVDGMDVNHQELIWIKPDMSPFVLNDPSRTLRSYGISSLSTLRLKLNEAGTQDLYEQMHSKGGVEHGFKGTALYSHNNNNNHASTTAAAAAAAAVLTVNNSAVAVDNSTNGEGGAATATSEVPASAPPSTKPTPVAIDTVHVSASSVALSPTLTATSSPASDPVVSPAEPMEVDALETPAAGHDGAHCDGGVEPPPAGAIGADSSAPILVASVAPTLPPITFESARAAQDQLAECKDGTASANDLHLAAPILHAPMRTDDTLSTEDSASDTSAVIMLPLAQAPTPSKPATRAKRRSEPGASAETPVMIE